MRSCSGTRIALLQLAFVLFALLAACGQIERKVAHSAQELKYYRDLRECDALVMRNFLVELPYWAIDPGMKSAGSVSATCTPGEGGGACGASDQGGDELPTISAVDRHVLKINSYRQACMSSKGWQQTFVEDLRRTPDSGSAWEWGSQAAGERCKHHSQCAENLYCREDACASFMTSPWGGMGRDDHCSAYYDCNIGLLCQKEICTPAGVGSSGSPLLPGDKSRGARCSAHYQCGNGLLCRAEVCTPAATVEVEPIGNKSHGASCAAHYQCTRELLCRKGVCG